MTVKIVAYKERGWFNYDTLEWRSDYRLWDHTCRAFGADLQLIDRWDEAELVGTVVLVDQKGTTLLQDFTHPPEDVTYVFGRSGLNDLVDFVPYDHIIRIETGDISLFGVAAGSIVLHHRKVG